MLRTLQIAVLAALGGCVAVPPAPPENSRPYRLTNADTLAIAQAFYYTLKDPESARFAGIRAVRGDSGLVYVCGYVNSRNGFGGYTGFEAFAGTGIRPVRNIQRWSCRRSRLLAIRDLSIRQTACGLSSLRPLLARRDGRHCRQNRRDSREWGAARL